MVATVESVVCSKCQQALPPEAFTRDARNSTGLQSQCRACRKPAADAWREQHPHASRDWKRANRDHVRDYKRQYHKDNPEKQRHSRLRRQFDLTPEQYDAMLSSQNGGCAICGGQERRADPRTGQAYALAVDHDHETGRVRGLLCSNCNRALGWLNDDPDRLRSAASYLERTSCDKL